MNISIPFKLNQPERLVLKQNSPITKSKRELYVDALDTEKALSEYGVIVTDVLPTPTVRDGGPRAEGITVSVNKIYGTHVEDAGEPVIVVEIDSSSVFVLADEVIVEHMLSLDATKSETDVKGSHPDLFDGEDVNELIVTANGLIAYNKDNFEQVAGDSTRFTLALGDGTILFEN